MNSGNLVLYKSKPAILLSVGEKLEIQLQDGTQLKVREKDLLWLHDGPLTNFSQLAEQDYAQSLEEAYNILEGSSTTLKELTSLVASETGPGETWNVWVQALGEWYEGTPDNLVPINPGVRQKKAQDREAKDAKQKEWEESLGNLIRGVWTEKEKPLLTEVESYAMGRIPSSRILKAAGKKETPESAHYWLLQLGFWKNDRDPAPERMGLKTFAPEILLKSPRLEGRKDLRDLPAFAIDDEGNQDPDDAISWDGNRLWVHIADPACIIEMDDDADLEARSRGATLYLPQLTSPMLPLSAVRSLGLGLAEESPALSFSLGLSKEGTIEDILVIPSLIRVRRLTYNEADGLLDSPDFQDLYRITRLSGENRKKNGSIQLKLPEVKIHYTNLAVKILPVLPLESRAMVTESMLLAGQAAALWAQAESLPFAFSRQDAPENPVPPGDDLASQFATRKQLKKASLGSSPGRHAGLGLDAYTQVTSPLRRYLDLTAHQQIRRRLAGEQPISYQDMSVRISIAEEASGLNRKCERLSRMHFTLLWHLENPDWVGEGVIVEKKESQAVILVPETALETRIPWKSGYELNQILTLKATEISLPHQSIRMTVQ